MNNSRSLRILATLLIICLTMSNVSANSQGDTNGTTVAKSSELTTFPDIQGHWCQKVIEKFISRNWVKGYDDGLFRPNKLVTRAEFTAMVINVLKKLNPDAKCDFKDVSENNWYYKVIASSVYEDYIKGYPDKTFMPHKEMSRQEVAVFSQRLLKVDIFNGETVVKFTDENTFPDWSKDSIKALASHEIIKGYDDGTFRPFKLATRAEAVKMLDIILKILNLDEETPIPNYIPTSTPTNKPTNTPTTNPTNTPTSGVIIPNPVPNPVPTPAKVKPVADFIIEKVYYRDPQKSNQAIINIKDSSYSNNNDSIRQRIWKLKFDSNNDDSFEDEAWVNLDNSNNTSIEYKTDEVGKYLLELEVSETADISKAEPHQKSDTGSKLYQDKVFEVQNRAPEANFSMEKPKKLDVVFTLGKADSDKVNTYSQKIDQFTKRMQDNGIDINVSKISSQSYTTKNTFDWTEYDHYYYIDNYNNAAWPNPMEKHILYKEKDIQMVGYTITAMKDFLFIPDNNKTQKTFEFDLQRDTTDWHSMEGGGFLFNASIENNILKGYCILITQSGLKLDEITGINLTQFRDGKYNLVEEAGKLLATYKIGDVYENHNWKIIIDSETITLWDNGKLVIDNYKLPNTNYGSGFGPITSHANHGCSQMSYFTFKNIEMASVIGKGMTEAIGEFQWRNGAERLLVSLSDEGLFELDSPQKIAKISNELVKKSIDFYGIGSSKNKDQYENVIKGTGGNGFFVPSDDLENQMKLIEDYTLEKFSEKDFTVGTYIEPWEEIIYKVDYDDYEGDILSQTNWRYIHNTEGIKNNQGIIEQNNKYINEPIKIFEKIGNYEIYLKSQDNPVGSKDLFDQYKLWSDESKTKRNIQVHRAPEVDIIPKISLSSDKLWAVVEVEENAVDKDHEGDTNNGIEKREYKWKNVMDEEWTYEQFPETLPLDNDYIFVLTVKDKEGTSASSVKLISTRDLNVTEIIPIEDDVKPTLDFTLSHNTINLGQTLTITATMSDNTGITKVKASVGDEDIYFDSKGICTYLATKPGDMKVSVQVFDGAGNSTLLEKDFKVNDDTTPPSITIRASDEVALNQTFTISISASDGSGIKKLEIDVDGKKTVLGRNYSLSVTLDKLGEIPVKATAYDIAGNVASVDKIIKVVNDIIVPKPAISSLNTVAIGQKLAISLSATDNVKVDNIQCEINGEKVVLEEGNKYTIIPEAEGEIIIKAIAYDLEGNEGSLEKKIIVTKDTTPPTVSISSSSTVLTHQNFTVTVTTSDNVGVTKLKGEVNGVPVEIDQSGKISLVAPEVEGEISIVVYAYDSVGNEGTKDKKITVNKDAVLPSVSISSSANSVIAGKSFTITINGSDNIGVAKLEAVANGVPLELDSNNKCVIETKEPGTIEVIAYAYDKSGNKGTNSRTITVNPDIIKPSISYSANMYSATVGQRVEFTLTATDNIGVTLIEATVNGEPVVVNEQGKYSFIASVAGNTLISVKAYDAAGNIGVYERNLNVEEDKTLPSLSITMAKTVASKGEKLDFSVKATDNVGVVKIEVFYDEAIVLLDENGSGSITPEKSGKLIFSAYDQAGNVRKVEKSITVN